MPKKTNNSSTSISIPKYERGSHFGMERYLVEPLPLSVKIFDPQGNLLFINKQGRKEHLLEGWADERIRKWDYLKSITPQHRPRVSRAMRDALAGKFSTFSVRHTKSHAHGGLWSCHISPIKIHGKVQLILFSSLNIAGLNESDEAERKRRKDTTPSNKKMELLLRSIPYPMDIVDENLNVLWANDRLKAVCKGEVVGKKCYEIYRDDKIQCSHCPLKKPIRVGETKRLVTDRMLGGRTFQITHAGMRFEGKKAILETFEDVTERTKAESELAVRNSLLSSMHEASAEGVLAVDPQGKSIYHNRRFIEMWQIPKEIEQTGEDRKMIQFVLSQLVDPKAFVRQVEKLYADPDRTSTDELRFIDGRTFSRFTAPLKDSEGRHLGRTWFFRDLTPLRSEEAKFRSIFENAIDGILIADAKTKRFVMANPAICRFLGYRKEELLKRGVPDIHPKKDLPFVLGQFMKLAQKKIIVSPNIPCLRKDGTILYADIAASKAKIGDRISVVGYFRDITKRKKAEETLRASEEQLKLLFNNTSDGIFQIDPHGKIVMLNHAFAKMHGYTVDEMLKMNLGELDNTATAKLVPERMRRILAGEKMTFNVEHVCKDGSLIQLEVTASQVWINNRKFIIAFHRDITERKKTDDALRESEERFRFLTERSLDAIFKTDVRGIITYISPAFMRMSGFRKADVVGAPFDHFLAKGEKTKAHAAFETSNRSRAPILNLQLKVLKNDGRFFWGELNSHPIITDGHVVGSEGSIRDITRRKVMEAAVRESEEKFRAISQLSPIGLYTTDPQGECTYANERWCEMSGLTPKEALGKGWAKGIHPEDRQAVFESWNRMIASKGHWGKEYRFKNKTGVITWVYGLATPKKDPNGKTTGYIGVNIDITERKKAEEALLKSEKRYHDIFEASQDALMLLDKKGFFDCNQATLKIFGYKTVKEFCSKHPGQVSPPAQPDGTPSISLANQRIDEAFKKGYNLFEWIHRQKNGSDFPASVLLVPFELEGRQVLQATVRDITEQKKAEEAILDWAHIPQENPRPILRIDKRGVLLYANPAASRLLKGWKPKIGQPLAIPLWMSLLPNLRSKKPVELELALGENLFSCLLVPVPERQYFNLYFLDITDRHRAEESLSKFKLGIERSEQIVFMTDRMGAFTHVNPAFEKIYGYKAKEVYGKTPRILKSGRQNRAFYKILWKTLLDGKSINLDVINKTKDGRLLAIHESTNPILDNKGQIIGFIAIQSDVTDQRRVENKIRLSEERLRAIFDYSRDAIMTLEPPDWRYASVNPSALRMFACQNERSFMRHDPKLYSPETQPDGKPSDIAMKAMIERARKEGSALFEWTHRRLTGETFPATVLLNRVSVGDKTFLQATVRDISEQKSIEQSKMELISMASHQLRTPPTGIKWYANMLLEEDVGKINPMQRSYLKEILFNNQKMIDLVHSLLSVSRIELGTIFANAKLQRVLPSRVIDDILEELGTQIQGKRLIVIKNYEKSTPSLQTDPGLLRIILHNLIDNATLYTRPRDRITLGAKKKKSKIMITVSDTGPGIPKALQPKLFSKFFHVGKITHKKNHGTGLGLYIAKLLTVAMGGTLQFKSALGKGSDFLLTLPIKSALPIMTTHPVDHDRRDSSLILHP